MVCVKSTTYVRASHYRLVHFDLCALQTGHYSDPLTHCVSHGCTHHRIGKACSSQKDRTCQASSDTAANGTRCYTLQLKPF